MRFENKTVIITGAGQGIGRAYAQEFAKAGAAVVVADLNIEKAQAVAAEIQAENGQALAVKVDVSDDKSTAEMVAQAVKAFGTVDVLINNAAVFSTLKMKPFEEIDADEWDFVMGVNARGVFNCIKAVSPFMKQQQSGKIINISSSVVVTGRANYAHYVASKGAVVALTRALATELGELPSSPLATTRIAVKLLWLSPTESVTVKRNTRSDVDVAAGKSTSAAV